MAYARQPAKSLSPLVGDRTSTRFAMRGTPGNATFVLTCESGSAYHPGSLAGGAIVSKKQSRQNRGARTGGHERSTPAETKEQAQTPAAHDPVRSISEQVSHKKQRKFGHN